jgi:hypothetical protein
LQHDKTLPTPPAVQGPWRDLALHTIGWKAFQDLCAHVLEDVLKLPVEVYREAQDDGQDAVFLTKKRGLDVGTPTTVQCKFSTIASRSLKAADLTKEEEHVVALKAAGYADRYVLMTSMSVSAPVASAIKARLRELGVRNPHVLGKEFLTRVIRSSSRLRALVPLVYGLGDLATILDQRRADQARAVLGHLQPSLRAYVPTGPHVKAVRALSQHNIVLLVGDAATGKSTIAAVLATIAADDPRHRCFKADGPKELIENWNPHEGGALYWIDDAFGANQLREDFVDVWISIMPKVQAAIAGNNFFILTSRRHIYEAAKPRLGSRNHPLFRDGQAVVAVGTLTTNEREQILYNHVKFGTQTKSWKSVLKRNHLKALANEELLNPEIARQLGDPAYTANVNLEHESLVRFVRSNRGFLNQTIKELAKASRAALTLVFLHGGKMPVGNPSAHMQEIVVRHYDVDRETLSDALLYLKHSFVVEKVEGSQSFWVFKHPTLSDALAAALGEAEGMRELYLRGVNVQTVVADTVCAGERVIRDAVVLPETLNGLLVQRLLELPDDGAGLNRALYGYLAYRASDPVFQMLVEQNPRLFARVSSISWRAGHDPKVQTFARAHEMGRLPSEYREPLADRLERELFDELDTSFLDDHRVLNLLSVSTLLNLVLRIKRELIEKFDDRIEQCVEEADLDLSPQDNFEDVTSAVNALVEFLQDKDDDVYAEAAVLLNRIERGMEKIAEKKEAAQREREREAWMWDELAAAGAGNRTPVPQRATATFAPPSEPRSIFSDVDE